MLEKDIKVGTVLRQISINGDLTTQGLINGGDWCEVISRDVHYFQLSPKPHSDWTSNYLVDNFLFKDDIGD